MRQLNAGQPVDMMEIARQTTQRDVERLPKGTVKAVAPAKVNLYLGVGPRRADGYHDVCNVMQTVMLHDVVYLWPAGAPGEVTCECRACEGLPPLDAVPADNLACRAVRALAARVFDPQDAAPGVGIRIEKHIPAQAGLGGGSSDAAAALMGAARLWEDAGAVESGVITTQLLEEVAAGVGADAAFFLRGGAALYDGVGERFVRAFASRRDSVVIIKPEEGLSTAAVYRAFDEGAGAREAAGNVEGSCCSRFGGDAQDGSLTSAAQIPLFNALQAPAESQLSLISDIIAFAAAQPGVTAVQMSGSGSAVFAICTDFGSACKLTAAAKLKGWWARTTAFGPVRAAVTPA